MRLVCETPAFDARRTRSTPSCRPRGVFRLTKKSARQILLTLFAIKFIKRRNPELRRTASTVSSGISCFLFLHQSLSDRSPRGSLNRTRCHFERSREIPRGRNETTRTRLSQILARGGSPHLPARSPCLARSGRYPRYNKKPVDRNCGRRGLRNLN